MLSYYTGNEPIDFLDNEVDVLERWTVGKVWEAVLAQHVIQKRMCFLLYFGMQDHVEEEDDSCGASLHTQGQCQLAL